MFSVGDDKKTALTKRKNAMIETLQEPSIKISVNTDVEKNVFDNLFNTMLNIHGKTKDTLKSRQELNTYCQRSELDQLASTGKYPKACYTLDNKAKKELFNWLTKLKFPDGYVSNMGRCVDK